MWPLLVLAVLFVVMLIELVRQTEEEKTGALHWRTTERCLSFKVPSGKS